MSQKRKAPREMRKRTRKKERNLGILNCLTLFVPSGTRNMVIFLKATSHSRDDGNLKTRPRPESWNCDPGGISLRVSGS